MFRLCASGGTQKEAKLWGIRPGSVYFPGNCLPQCIMVFRIWRMSFSVLQGNHVRLEHRLIGWWILQEKYGVPALLVCSPSVKFTFCLGSTTVRLCKTIYVRLGCIFGIRYDMTATTVKRANRIWSQTIATQTVVPVSHRGCERWAC